MGLQPRQHEEEREMADAQFVLGVDLDGVVADFYRGLRVVAAEWLEVPIKSLTKKVSFNVPEWKLSSVPGGYDALHKFAVTQRAFFLNLKPMPGAAMALQRLSEENIRIRVITHRLFIKYFHQTAVRQTVEWLDKYDIPYWDLCFMKDKAAVGADLYIEDAPLNIKALRRDGHPTIVFANSTNRDMPKPRAADWEHATKLVLRELARWNREQKKKKKSSSGV
jgi:5'(3')-deoxyribonucleotidase